MKTYKENMLGGTSIFIIPCSTMTMEELLVSLTKKAKLECEEEHRQVVASMNGLSGLHIIRNEVHVEGFPFVKTRATGNWFWTSWSEEFVFIKSRRVGTLMISVKAQICRDGTIY